MCGNVGYTIIHFVSGYVLKDCAALETNDKHVTLLQNPHPHKLSAGEIMVLFLLFIPPDFCVRPVPLVRRLVVPDGLLRRPQLEVGLRPAEGRLLVVGGEAEGGGAVANAVRVPPQLRRRREF